jgi:plastocyanin
MKKIINVSLTFFLIQIYSLTVTAVRGSEEHEHSQGKFTKHLADSKMLVTEKGLFSVEMSINDKRLLVGVNTLDLIIHDKNDRDVTGADITFTPWMPEMGHGVFESPVVMEKGRGLYTVENIVLVMGGHWEIRIHIKKDDTGDKVVFDFPYVRTTDEYEYIKAKTPAGFNAVIGMQNKLEELKPDIVAENGQSIKVFTLTVKDVGFEIFPEQPMMGWGFNGQIPGPTIRVTEGDRIRVILKNKTNDEHTIHIHGQTKPVVMDGVPYLGQKPVKKGESYTYEFVVNYLGTSWYHCHVDSAHHVDMGMYGAFIVEPKNEKLVYDREYIMILDEWPTKHVHVHADETEMEDHDEHGIVTIHEGAPPVHEHPSEKPAKRDWYPKTHRPHRDVYDGFTINGRSFPFTEPVVVKKGERVRIRFINAGYQPHFMHTHSHKFIVVARDGAYVNEPQKIDTVAVGPGQRVDILLFADNPGIWPFHCHRLDHVTNEHIYPGGMITFIKYVE